jgi:hypothetical protein
VACLPPRTRGAGRSEGRRTVRLGTLVAGARLSWSWAESCRAKRWLAVVLVRLTYVATGVAMVSGSLVVPEAKSPAWRGFPVRPRGLEPPRTIQSTRPSTRITLRRYGFWRLIGPNWSVFCTDWTPWTGWMLPRVLPRIWRHPTGKGGPRNFERGGWLSTAQPS